MPAQNLENFKRECIIRGSSEIIITENGDAVLYKVSDNSKFMTSNIFAARIMEYAPQLYSYFVDIGDSRRALLNAPEGAYRIGDFCIVQIVTAARDQKGARVTAQIRLTGIFTVLLVSEKDGSIHISSKIKESDLRERLTMIGESLCPECALILRTQAASASPAEIAKDYANLDTIWRNILHRYEERVSASTPGVLFAGNPIVSELLKYPLQSYSEICADTPDMIDILRQTFPEARDRIRFLPKQIFAVKSVDRVKTSLLGKKIFLRSGANLVIEKTEALTVIDVNTSKSSLSYKEVNFEAAQEIMRQLRLRDIGGIVICDFIDVDEKHDREALVSYLRELAQVDPAKPEIPGITSLGLIEIVRKRS